MFDYIYARLVLHYLSNTELQKVLYHFYESLKKEKKLFIVVRSVKNIPLHDKNVKHDELTNKTYIPEYNKEGKIYHYQQRYFHSKKSISDAVVQAGFTILNIAEYFEELFEDYERMVLPSRKNHVIEILVKK